MSMFFITGLPRSLTAWMANFMSCGRSFCHHEPVRGCVTRRDLWDKLENTNKPHVGASDSALMFLPFQEQYPEAPTLIIERCPDEVASSLAGIGLYNRHVAGMLRAANKELNKLSGERVPFDKLHDNLQGIWEYLVGPGFDELRAKQLKRMNIQTTDYGVDTTALRLLEGTG